MSARMDRPNNESARPSLAISDHHLLVAHGIAQALGHAYEIQGVVRSGRELEALLHTNAPDLVVTEIDLLDQDGLETLRRIRSLGLKIPFVFCTSRMDSTMVRQVFYAGARGIVAKQEGVDELRSAIGMALQGKAYLSGAFLHVLTEDQRQPAPRLTPRQRRILELLDEGMTAQRIADALGLSRRTVETHKLALSRATGARSVVEVLARARRFGLLEAIGH